MYISEHVGECTHTLFKLLSPPSPSLAIHALLSLRAYRPRCTPLIHTQTHTLVNYSQHPLHVAGGRQRPTWQGTHIPPSRFSSTSLQPAHWLGNKQCIHSARKDRGRGRVWCREISLGRCGWCSVSSRCFWSGFGQLHYAVNMPAIWLGPRLASSCSHWFGSKQHS